MPEPSPPTAGSVAIQSILFHTPFEAVRRTVGSLENSLRVGRNAGFGGRVVVVLGDASPEPCLTDELVDQLRAECPHLDEIRYEFFDENTGTSKGHNRMARLTDTDYLITANPDVVIDARALWRMWDQFRDETVGMVEAKQIPVEHPKEYKKDTGDTSWAATAFAMTSRKVFDLVGGFDEQTFFMYCDDVDYSWLCREAGYRVVFVPSAVVFHDKRLTAEAKWQPTKSEIYYQAEAAMLLAHKWSRPDIADVIAAGFEKSRSSEHKRAAREFERRREAGELVAPHDPEHRVGQFKKGFYAEHRYAL